MCMVTGRVLGAGMVVGMGRVMEVGEDTEAREAVKRFCKVKTLMLMNDTMFILHEAKGPRIWVDVRRYESSQSISIWHLQHVDAGSSVTACRVSTSAMNLSRLVLATASLGA